MDYLISITGTLDDGDEVAEEEVMSEAADFALDLEGVSAATFSSPNFKGVDLLQEEEAPEGAEAPEEAPAEPAPAEEGDGNGSNEEAPAEEEGDGEE